MVKIAITLHIDRFQSFALVSYLIRFSWDGVVRSSYVSFYARLFLYSTEISVSTCSSTYEVSQTTVTKNSKEYAKALESIDSISYPYLSISLSTRGTTVNSDRTQIYDSLKGMMHLRKR